MPDKERKQMNITTQKRKIHPAIGFPLAIVVGIAIAYAGVGAYRHFVNPGAAGLKTLDEETVMLRMTGSFSNQGAIDADTAVPTIQAVCGNPKTKTVIFYLHSEGGSGVEAERISNAITRHCEKKETIALVEGACLSACYQVAVRADRIYTNQFSYIGSIGTIVTWTDYAKQLAAQGVEERQIASGPKKGGTFGSMMLTPAQVDNLQQVVTSSGKAFIDEVVQFRKGKLIATSGIEDGGVYSGQDALRVGLVDAIKTVDDLRDQYPEMKELDNTYTGRVMEIKPRKSETKLADAMERAQNAVR